MSIPPDRINLGIPPSVAATLATLPPSVVSLIQSLAGAQHQQGPVAAAQLTRAQDPVPQMGQATHHQAVVAAPQTALAAPQAVVAAPQPAAPVAAAPSKPLPEPVSMTLAFRVVLPAKEVAALASQAITRIESDTGCRVSLKSEQRQSEVDKVVTVWAEEQAGPGAPSSSSPAVEGLLQLLARINDATRAANIDVRLLLHASDARALLGSATMPCNMLSSLAGKYQITSFGLDTLRSEAQMDNEVQVSVSGARARAMEMLKELGYRLRAAAAATAAQRSRAPSQAGMQRQGDTTPSATNSISRGPGNLPETHRGRSRTPERRRPERSPDRRRRSSSRSPRPRYQYRQRSRSSSRDRNPQGRRRSRSYSPYRDRAPPRSYRPDGDSRRARSPTPDLRERLHRPSDLRDVLNHSKRTDYLPVRSDPPPRDHSYQRK